MKKLKMLALALAASLLVLSQSVMAKEEIEPTHISVEAQVSCYEYGKMYDICPELLMAMIEAESSGNPRAENGDCKGLMQISERWHTGRMVEIGADDIWSETDNIHIGANYLHELFNRYEDVALVLMVYNGESDAVEKAENGYISDYARKILDRSAELERWKGK
jgi:soluble lytic murein transglycosylase-like protein